jgi:TPR repeat protein
MALYQCKECTGLVSDQAKACPKCGAKIPKGSAIFNIVMILLIGWILLSLWGNYSRINDTAPSDSKQFEAKNDTVTATPLITTSKELAEIYSQNEARADAAFKNKHLRVTGKIIALTKDFKNDTIITLGGQNGVFGVNATILDSEEQKAMTLDKGQVATVECIGRGEVISIPMLDNCLILETSARDLLSIAEAGDSAAQNELGNLYYNGQRGVTTNHEQAFNWYKKAAHQGLAKAQFNLATMYYEGEGVSKNEEEAVKWFRKAANQGVTDPGYKLIRSSN